MIDVVSVVVIVVAANSNVAAQHAPSEKYVWKNVKIVAGGFVTGIEFSPKQPGLAYCRTDIGSFYRWDSSLQQWTPLCDWCGVSNLMGGESLATDPVDPNKLYLAAGMGSRSSAAIMRSIDRGKTFEVIPVPFAMGGNENGRGLGERLAIDPNSPNILYFGSRHDGLWISRDSASTWHKVHGFPIKGSDNQNQDAGFGNRGLGFGAGSNVGLSFVVFDASSSLPGSPCQTIFVGSTEPGDSHLFCSTNAGSSWEVVAGQPPPTLVPRHAELDSMGMLYISYGNGPGPNNITDGAVWKLNTKNGEWTDITPLTPKHDGNPGFGYGGLSIDRQHPGTLAIATIDRWNPTDDVLRSTDGGKTWNSINAQAHLDISRSPYLSFGAAEPRFGWWMDALAIDPFNSSHMAYGTGATIYATNDVTLADVHQATHWSVWADGIEETAVAHLLSPNEGVHLISALADIGGFTHDDLDLSPPTGMHKNPVFVSTYSVDYAEKNPNVVVRSGTGKDGGMAYSVDGGQTWSPLHGPANSAINQDNRGFGRGGHTGGLVVSANGSTFMSLSGTPEITRDRGTSWTACQGLPAGLRPLFDRVNPLKSYALDVDHKQIYISTDGGASFQANPSEMPDLPVNSGNVRRGVPGGSRYGTGIVATQGMEGDLWLIAEGILAHSVDGGATFMQLTAAPVIMSGDQNFGFGKAAPGKDYPALFVAGSYLGDTGIFRSDDSGHIWMRINDDQHQYGTRFRAVTGDPRIYGRVYVGTDGRGIVYGDIAP
ncbi:MAG TPA: xyloglucanase [Pirellulales bacterium]|nr:xyloglucanase [Pirellulales bacterium]